MRSVSSADGFFDLKKPLPERRRGFLRRSSLRNESHLFLLILCFRFGNFLKCIHGIKLCTV